MYFYLHRHSISLVLVKKKKEKKVRTTVVKHFTILYENDFATKRVC